MLGWFFRRRAKTSGSEARTLASAQEHQRAGRSSEAATLYLEVINRNPALVDAHAGLGSLYLGSGELDKAMECYGRATALAPGNPSLHTALGHVHRDRGEFDAAIACYRRAIALGPESPSVLVNLGNVLNDAGRPAEAISHFERALAIRPDYPDAHANLGNALQYLGLLEESVAAYRRAVALDPEYAEAHHNLGNALETLDRRSEACESFRRVLSIRPDYVEARWALTMSQLSMVYASESEAETCRAAFSGELEALDRWFSGQRLSEGHRAVGIQQPFPLGYLERNNRELLERYGNICVRLMRQWDRPSLPQRSVPAATRDRVRVGVVTPYLCSHSVWDAILRGWFEHIDSTRFAMHAFHLGPTRDQATLYAESRAAHFEQRNQGLQQWVNAIRAQKLDVLIFPEIGMDPLSVKLASLRLAPIQATSWGHPETSGLPTMDYYISAQGFEPPNARENYSERLHLLPNLGCCYRRLEVQPAPPVELDIPAEVPLLLCPGTPFKYAPHNDEVLTAIARELRDCRFLFFSHPSRLHLEAKLRARLARAFASASMRFEDYVRFLPWHDRASFYGLMRRADVYLDTIGFSGFNTAMQAVDNALPIVTREGRFLRGRFAAGIMRRIGLHELVARSNDEYLAIAVRIARDASYRSRIREEIAARRAVLYEDALPIRALEEFLREVTARR